MRVQHFEALANHRVETVLDCGFEVKLRWTVFYLVQNSICQGRRGGYYLTILCQLRTGYYVVTKVSFAHVIHLNTQTNVVIFFCDTMEMNGEQHNTISALHKTMLVLREEIELKNRIILKMRKQNQNKIKRQISNKIYSQNPFGVTKVWYKYFQIRQHLQMGQQFLYFTIHNWQP